VRGARGTVTRQVLHVGDPRRILQLAMQPPSIASIEDSIATLKLAGKGRRTSVGARRPAWLT